MPITWDHRFAGSSVLAGWAPPFFRNGLDPDTTEGAINLVYALPNLHVLALSLWPIQILDENHKAESAGSFASGSIVQATPDFLLIGRSECASISRLVGIFHHELSDNEPGLSPAPPGKTEIRR